VAPDAAPPARASRTRPGRRAGRQAPPPDARPADGEVMRELGDTATVDVETVVSD
jgi:hypothetical protein